MYGPWVPGVMKGASVSKRIQSALRESCLVDDGIGVELSCEGKEGERMAVIPMLVFMFFIIDNSEQSRIKLQSSTMRLDVDSVQCLHGTWRRWKRVDDTQELLSDCARRASWMRQHEWEEMKR